MTANGLEHGIVTEQLYPSCRLLSMTIGQPIPNNKARGAQRLCP